MNEVERLKEVGTNKLYTTNSSAVEGATEVDTESFHIRR